MVLPAPQSHFRSGRRRIENRIRMTCKNDAGATQIAPDVLPNAPVQVARFRKGSTGFGLKSCRSKEGKEVLPSQFSRPCTVTEPCRDWVLSGAAILDCVRSHRVQVDGSQESRPFRSGPTTGTAVGLGPTDLERGGGEASVKGFRVRRQHLRPELAEERLTQS